MSDADPWFYIAVLQGCYWLGGSGGSRNEVRSIVSF